MEIRYKNKKISMGEKLHNYIWGSFWFILALILIISLVTYNENDASFNLITTSTRIHNYLGKFGSYLSDLMLQLFGEVSFLFPFLFFTFTFNIFRNHFVYNVKKKIFAFIGFMAGANILFDSGVVKEYLLSFFEYTPEIVLELLATYILFISFTILMDLRKNNWLVWSAKFKNMIKRIYVKMTTHGFGMRLFRLLIKKQQYIEIKTNILEENTNKTQMQMEELLQEKDGKNYEENEIPLAITDNNDNNIFITTKKEIVRAKDIKQTSFKDYILPRLELLKDIDFKTKSYIPKDELLEQSNSLVKVLKDYKVDGKITNVRVGPVVTLFEFEPQAGIKTSRVVGLADDVARNMLAISTRISTLSGKNTLGIELPNKKRETIYIKGLLESKEYQNTMFHLPILLGTDISGEVLVKDLAAMPHLLVAGTTGSGKSVAINTMIASLLYKLSPEQCKFIMIDPKMLELSVYEGIPHLLAPVVTEPLKAISALKWVCKEMEDRYRIMASLGVRNIDGYNEKLQDAIKNNGTLVRKIQIGYDEETGEPIYEEKEIEQKEMPYIVVIVDEMADLMITAGKEIEASVQRIAQKARAAGIHIIMATQRPSVDVITGVIKANFPTRMSFQVVSGVDSKTILGQQGAEQLLGKGDMLFMAGGGKIVRAHGPFVSDEEVESVVNSIKKQGIKPKYIEEVLQGDDEVMQDNNNEPIIEGNVDLFGSNPEKELYEQALEVILRARRPTISYLQTMFKIGYQKAANLINDMEKNGVLSAPDLKGKRTILVENK